MQDYERIIEEIQTAITSDGDVDWDLLRDTAVEYSVICGEVNDRLVECDRLLKKGLRSEALQVAERDLNLLDCVALLDFPELEQWRQLLKAGGMIAPTLLRLDVAGDLNAAYADEAPLHSLLKKHRGLALARAPLVARINVLRQIRLADIMNSIWSDDLRLLELARHREIEKELDVRIGRREVEHVSRLVRECEDDSWVYSPPPHLVQQTKQRQQRLAALLATEDMERIELELSAAYAQLDADAGRAARTQWNRARQAAGLSANHPLIQRAAASLAWLSEEDLRTERANAFSEAIARLESALEAPTEQSPVQLENLFHNAAQFDEEIPLQLVRRYRERVATVETTARRRFYVAITASVAAMLLIAAAGVWFTLRAQQERTVLAAARAMGRLLDDHNSAEAEQLFAQFKQHNPTLVPRPEIQQELGRLNAQLEGEKSRKQLFEAHLARAIEAGVDEPDRSSFNEANKLAKTVEEKTRAADWDTKLGAADRDRQERRDSKFGEEFDRLLAAIEGLEMKVDGLEIDPTDINRVVTAIDELQRNSGAVTYQLVGKLTPLRQRAVVVTRQLSDARVRQESLLRLTKNINNTGRFQSAMEGFIKEYDSTVLAVEFQRVIPELKWSEEFLNWTSVLEDESFSNPASLNRPDGPALAKAVVDRGDSLLRAGADCSLAQIYRIRRDVLTKVANRVENGKPRIEALAEEFRQPLIRGIQLLELNSGERFYLKEGAKAESGGTNRLLIPAIFGFDMRTKNQNRPNDVRYLGAAPQSRIFARAAMPRLESDKPIDPPFTAISKGDWEKGFADLIDLVADPKDLGPSLDPLLQFVLLQSTINTAREGSHSLDVALATAWQRAKNTTIDPNSNWLVWDDEVAKESREQAASVLRELKISLANYRSTATAVWRQDTAALPELPRWIGWLRPVGRNWSCEANEVMKWPGELFVVSTSIIDGTETKPNLRRIAKFNGKNLTWELSDDGRFVAGRPVFFVRDAVKMTEPVGSGKLDGE